MPKCDYFTPEWAAALLVEQFLPDLSAGDIVIEPSCGRGAFLKALPTEVHAIGVELDPALAVTAAQQSGREVICGDFRTVELPPAKAIIGNPPFTVSLIDAFLQRAHRLLPDNGRCGFILPAYAIQTPRHVIDWATKWTLRQDAIPRTLFPRLTKPLVFVTFVKERQRRMFGFLLYQEAVDVQSLAKGTQLLLTHGAPGRIVWRALVETGMRTLGGKVSLDDLYHWIEPRRPTANAFWKEKVRQQVQRIAIQLSRGTWQLREV